MIDKTRIAEEAKHFFEWPDPAHRDTVTLTSCVIFANVIAEMARTAERERCAKLCDQKAEGHSVTDEALSVWNEAADLIRAPERPS